MDNLTRPDVKSVEPCNVTHNTFEKSLTST